MVIKNSYLQSDEELSIVLCLADWISQELHSPHVEFIILMDKLAVIADNLVAVMLIYHTTHPPYNAIYILQAMFFRPGKVLLQIILA